MSRVTLNDLTDKEITDLIERYMMIRLKRKNSQYACTKCWNYYNTRIEPCPGCGQSILLDTKNERLVY